MNTRTTPRVVSRQEWLSHREKLLAKEKELTHLRDALARERLQLPWVKLDKSYVFEDAGGKKSLRDLFAGRSQLAIYHFMFGPAWEEGCPSCSMNADGFDGAIPHLASRDLTLVAVSRAPFARIAAFKKRMGWRFGWVSSHGSDFNTDFRVSFTEEEMRTKAPAYNYGTVAFPADEAPGVSMFATDDAGDVFHTYSTFARGGEPLMVPYAFLDMAPKGRNEAGLPFPMAWVRHHDRYSEGAGACAACANHD